MSGAGRPLARALAAGLIGWSLLGCDATLPSFTPLVDIGATRPDASPVDAASLGPLDARPSADMRPADDGIDRGSPLDEMCDGLDNDGDGVTDEGTSGTSCRGGVDRCAYNGVVQCVNGMSSCVGEAEDIRDETCNSTDDDCDGETDEGLDVGGQCTAGVGICSVEGIKRCAPGGVVECSVQARDDLITDEGCDGVDNDCDGEVDEAEDTPGVVMTQRCTVPGASGICADGARRCVAAEDPDMQWSACVGPPREDTELCNRVDDDCDGRMDEGFDRPGQACEVMDVPPQCADGRFTCSEDGRSSFCIKAAETRCDGEDDDCDGAVDEGEVCGRLLAQSCRAWLGWTVEDLALGVEAARWQVPGEPGGCPIDPVRSDTLSCDGGRDPNREGAFVELPISGDVDAVDDRFGTSFRCTDADGDGVVAQAQAACALYLGFGAAADAPANGASWGACPRDPVETDGPLVCTSGDQVFRPIAPPLDLAEGAVLAVAFHCSADLLSEFLADQGLPVPDGGAVARAELLQGSIEIYIAWADATVEGPIDWDAVCAPDGDDNPLTACAPTGGDGQFHRFEFTADLDAQDRLAIGLRPRAVAP